MNIIGKRWTALIIRDLASGTKRYCELERLLDNISPKVLSQRLSELEQQQIVKREVIAEVPVRVEYSLTAKGKDLVKVIDSMAAWGQQYQG
ncbi:MAG TPA: transcriptional regulator [Actinobacteria bacterium]|nr:transcriptional regulator [Actinomycetota bacterium]